MHVKVGLHTVHKITFYDLVHALKSETLRYYLTKVLDGLDALRPLWAKEINYDYLFDENVMPAHDKQRHLESTSGKNNKRKRNC